jgi:hypothetical protein
VTASGLVLNFVRDHDSMAREMARVTRSGGRVAAYVWDYAGGMQMMRHFWDAAIAVSPDDAKLDQAERFPLCQPAPLQALFERAGLKSVALQAIDIPTVFQDFDDYWIPFLGRTGAAHSYLASVPDEADRPSLGSAGSRVKSWPFLSGSRGGARARPRPARGGPAPSRPSPGTRP